MQASRRNRKKQLETALCSACLCSNRKLTALILELKKIYKQICKNIQGMNSEVFLCWECLALLRNVKKFQEKVQNSREILKKYISNRKVSNVRNFSNLTTTTPDIFDSNYVLHNHEEDDTKKPTTDIGEIKHEDVFSYYLNTFDFEENKDYVSPNIDSEETKEIKIIIEKCKAEPTVNDIDEIKHEDGDQFSYDSNNFDFDENNIDISPNSDVEETKEIEIINSRKADELDINIYKNFDLKSEEKLKEKALSPSKKSNSKLGKSVKKPRLSIRKNVYKITYHIESKAKTYKRSPIQSQEVSEWLEKERNSDYYKRLKIKCDKCAAGVLGDASKHYKCHVKPSIIKRGLYICDFCDYAFSAKSRLANHINSHYYIRCCNICGYKCVHKLHMYSHLRTSHRNKGRNVQCLECKDNFNSTWDFYSHYREIHYALKNIFFCDYCNKKFKTKNAIVKHITRHHLPHICKKCNVTYASYRFLKQHNALKHHIERTEASYCVQCDKQFDNIAQFKNHLHTSVAHASERRKSARSKALYSCPACPKVYRRKETMNSHYKMIHTDNAIKCTDCNKIFLTKQKLKSHVKYSHLGLARPRNHICTICGRGFTQSQVLVKHVRTHTGERPYECPHCDAKFAQKTPMLTHVKNIHMKREKMATGNTANR